MSLVAKFRSYRPWLNKEDISVPVPTQKEIPDWYKDADRFAKMPNGEYYKATKEVCPFPKEGTTDDYGKIPTWKACPAIMDAFATGYVFKTPCDLIFAKNAQGIINVTINDARYKDFCTQRPPMPQFEHPKGYYSYHFAWSSPWGLELPEGYSALFMTPMNRFDLPFTTLSGIVDSDMTMARGNLPFFLKSGFEGIIPVGTPIYQVMPFKRENWQSEHDKSITDIAIKNEFDTTRRAFGWYKNFKWNRKSYE